MGAGRPVPDESVLTGLSGAAWGAMLPTALAVLRALPEAATDPVIKRLLSTPPGRLVSGRSQLDLVRVLRRSGVWAAFDTALGDADRPWVGRDTAETGPPDDDGETARLEAEVQRLRDREGALSERLGEARAELESMRRRTTGLTARVAAVEAERDALREAVDEHLLEVEQLRAALAEADDARERAVQRARRRASSAVTANEDALREARREAEQLRSALQEASQRAADAETRAHTATERLAAVDGAAVDTSGHDAEAAGYRGRPSRLPDGVAAGTREAARWLLSDQRTLLIDGYNVTRTHRPTLGFPEQRQWLEQAVTTLTQRRHLSTTIVWDSSVGRPRTIRGRGPVTVRYTTAHMTADDELVLHVETLLEPDAPVAVVTDDVELRQRLAPHGVDLLDTLSFVWLL